MGDGEPPKRNTGEWGANMIRIEDVFAIYNPVYQFIGACVALYLLAICCSRIYKSSDRHTINYVAAFLFALAFGLVWPVVSVVVLLYVIGGTLKFATAMWFR